MIEATLHALVGRALARLPEEPQLHVKRALGLHAFEDAQSLQALGGPAAGHAPEGDSYADLKPAVIFAARTRIAALDPATQEDELRVLIELVHRQERHLEELPPRAPESGGREAFLERGPEQPGLHADLHAALSAAEAAASEGVDAPFETQLERAREVAEYLEETVTIERALAAEGRHWGDEPVQFTRP